MAAQFINVILKKDEEILRLNKRVLDASPDLIAVVSDDYKYGYVNPAYCDAHDLTAKDLLRKKVGDFVGNDIFEEIVKPRLDSCLSGEELRFEEWFDLPGIGERFMELRYLPLPNEKKKVDRIVVIHRDMTSMVEAERRKLNQEKLRTVVELAGTYNHEINNPLCSIKGYLELIRHDSTGSEKIMNYVAKALGDVERIVDVTKKLADATSISLVDYPGGDHIIKVAGEEHVESGGTAQCADE